MQPSNKRKFNKSEGSLKNFPKKALVNNLDAYFQPECDRRGRDRGYKKIGTFQSL